jgi:hypothetical protein
MRWSSPTSLIRNENGAPFLLPPMFAQLMSASTPKTARSSWKLYPSCAPNSQPFTSGSAIETGGGTGGSSAKPGGNGKLAGAITAPGSEWPQP